MSFCNKCGTQLEGDERFCSKCGNVITANGAATPVATQVPSPLGAPPLGAPVQMPIMAPGQVPMSVAIPPEAPAKKSGMMWLGIIVVAAAGYYYYTHTMQPQTQPAGNPPQTQPGVAPPGQQPPGGYPAQQPGGPAQGGNNAALVQMQAFTFQASEVNGQVQISGGQWTNHSNVAIQSASLECVQIGANGAQLSQEQITLTGPSGPVAPQSTINFDPFSAGDVVQGATRANCGIVSVIPAS